MGQIATAPHECEGHLVWVNHGLGPYWAIGQLLIQGYDGHGSIETEIDGETWQVELAYQKSGLAPGASDPINSERLYEYIITRGDGQRKASYNISPCFPNIRHWEKGHQITMPFDHIEADEGIDVEFRGSNVEPGLYKELLPKFVQALAAETHVNVSSKYFRGPVHPMSNIYTYERYVRLTRNMNKKLIGNAGAMQKIQLLLASERDTYAEITIDNEDVVGKRHQCR